MPKLFNVLTDLQAEWEINEKNMNILLTTLKLCTQAILNTEEG